MKLETLMQNKTIEILKGSLYLWLLKTGKAKNDQVIENITTTETGNLNIELRVDEDRKRLLQTPVRDLDISRDEYTALSEAKLKTLDDLVSLREDDVSILQGVGLRGLAAIRVALGKHDLAFRGN